MYNDTFDRFRFTAGLIIIQLNSIVSGKVFDEHSGMAFTATPVPVIILFQFLRG